MQVIERFSHQVYEQGALIDRHPQQFFSPKAQFESMFDPRFDILPRKLLITRNVVPAAETDLIVESMLAAVAKGCWVGVRTCFVPQPMKSPWRMGIKSGQNVAQFVIEVLPEWQQQPNLTEVIVMHNPPYLGGNQHKYDHFVMRLDRRNDHDYIEMRLYTDQLRDIDSGVERADLIQIHLNRSSFGYNGADINMGSNYGGKDKKIVENAIARLKQFSTNPSLRYHARLDALAERGLEMTEWQGRMDLSWLKIYGLRGTGDEYGRKN